MIYTRAERERRLLLLRQDLVDLRTSYVDSVFWRLFATYAAKFKLIDSAIGKVDAMLRCERDQGGPST